jgi:hypothetical protein
VKQLLALPNLNLRRALPAEGVHHFGQSAFWWSPLKGDCLPDSARVPARRTTSTRLQGGLCFAPHPCIACDDIITAMRDVEVEVSTPAGAIFLHSRVVLEDLGY